MSNPRDASSHWPLIRWFASSATMNVPQAAGPVAFSLLALSLTGDPSKGALVMVTMTVAQVAGAIPITRLGRRWPVSAYLRGLILVRTLALAAVASFAHLGQPVYVWLFPAAVAGSVNGAVFGYLRSLLNGLTGPDKLARALGISATLNELTFVLAPVLASVLGTVSPVFGLLAITLLGAAPAVFVPAVQPGPVAASPTMSGALLSPSVLLWLACSAAGGAAIAAVEIGSVALALRYDYAPALAIAFTVPLCVASVAGGLWVSVRNLASKPVAVAAQLGIMAIGAWLVAIGRPVGLTLVGAVLMGSVLAPLATHYSLTLDALAPPHRRPEVFALLRTANSCGVIMSGLALTAFPLGVALAIVATPISGVALTVAWLTLPQQRR